MARELSDAEFDAANRYWAAFGRFINYFSLVEQRLHSLLWELSGAPLELVRVAFADARFDKVTTMINRLYTSRGEAEHPLYRRAVDQLGCINRMRNDLVHFGAGIVKPENGPDALMLVSNEAKAFPGKEKSFWVDIDTIDNMSRDLRVALACLTVVLVDKNGPALNQMAELDWRRIAQKPWLYKPQQRSDEEPKGRKPRQARKSPHSPSEA